jgi:hypothetical protein
MFAMGRKGLMTALRYLGDAGDGPRLVRPDGRPLRRPLRAWSANARAEVARRRAARPQPRWPKVLGWSLLCMASLAAVNAEYPVPRPEPGVPSAARPLGLEAIRASAPLAVQEGIPAAFSWATLAAPPYTVVLYDEGYRELARVDGIGERRLPVPPQFAEALAGGGTFHWRVLAPGAAATLRSRLEWVEIR